MNEAYVRLLCPACSKRWEENPRTLPSPSEEYTCPDCDAVHPVAEFMRTDRDLETLKRLQ